MFGIVVIILIITAAGNKSLITVGYLLIFAMTLHMSIGATLGYYFGKLFKLNDSECKTVAIEVGMQNGGLASGFAMQMGKIATVGLAPAINGPVMNTVFSLIATYWSKKSESDFELEQIVGE